MTLEQLLKKIDSFKEITLYLYKYKKYGEITVEPIKTILECIDFHESGILNQIYFKDKNGGSIYFGDLDCLMEKIRKEVYYIFHLEDNEADYMMYSDKDNEEKLNYFKKLIIKAEEEKIQKYEDYAEEAKQCIPVSKEIIKNLKGDRNENN